MPEAEWTLRCYASVSPYNMLAEWPLEQSHAPFSLILDCSDARLFAYLAGATAKAVIMRLECISLSVPFPALVVNTSTKASEMGLTRTLLVQLADAVDYARSIEEDLENVVLKDDIGVPNGVAGLDSEGKVPTDQLPNMDYVPMDDVGAAGGVAPLDENRKVPAENLPDIATEDNVTITRNAQDKIQAVALRESNADAAKHIWVGTLQEWTEQDKASSTDICYITDDDREPMYISVVDDALSMSSTNPVQNRVVTNALGYKADLVDGKVPSSELPAMDYIPNDEKGAANGVAQLDENGKVAQGQLPTPTSSRLGAIKTYSGWGISVLDGGAAVISKATAEDIAARNNVYNAIVPNNLNVAVTAALTDSNHITLTSEQQATARSVIGVPVTLQGTGAPTISTVGEVGQRYEDTSTQKLYTCTAVTVDETDPQNPVSTYTWTDDINAKGGTFTGKIGIATVSYLGISISDWISIGTGNTGTGGDIITGQHNTSNSQYSLLVGNQLKANLGSRRIYCGFLNVSGNYSICVGNGTDTSHRSNAFEAYPNGDLYIAGGLQQGITDIPADTTAYNLSEGVFKHTPLSASTYSLPDVLPVIVSNDEYYTRSASDDGSDYYGWGANQGNGNISKRYTASATPSVGDNTYTNTALTSGAKAITSIDSRTHTISLTLDFTTVQTYAFQDASGNAITPLFTPTIAAGDVYTFKCEWSSLLNKWLIMPVKQGAVSDDYVMKAEVGVANGVAGLDSNGKVPGAELPLAGFNTLGITGIGANSGRYAGINVGGNGYMSIYSATTAWIDSDKNKTGFKSAITVENVDYAVRSVLPNITAIPAATSAYSLLDSSATTNNHSHTYTHAPDSAPTYTLPDVTDAAVDHSILLDVDFTTVQTIAFQDSAGTTVPLQKQITLSAGDKYRFICLYQFGAWRVYPLKMEA